MLSICCITGIAIPSRAASLSEYTNFTAHALSSASEASGVTYNRQTNSLYVIGDEGPAIFEYSVTGSLLSQMQLANFGSEYDPEGLTMLPDGKIMIASERRQTGYVVSYVPGGNANRLTSPAHIFAGGGENLGNAGLEGVSYDPITGSIYGVKEKDPSGLYVMTGFDTAQESVTTNPFHPRLWSNNGMDDLADIYVMANSNAFAGTPREMNLLVLSQESLRLLEVTRTGQVVGSLDISFLGRPGIEGVTMDDLGNIYLVGEQDVRGTDPFSATSALFVLSANAIPEPSTYALLALGGLGLWAFRRRQRKQAA